MQAACWANRSRSKFKILWGTDVGATNAYLKLAADDDVVAIIGPDNSNDNIAIAGSAESAQILTTGQGSSPTLQTTCEESEWMFQLRACDSTLCAALMDYAYNEVGAKSFTIIHDTETAVHRSGKIFSRTRLRSWAARWMM